MNITSFSINHIVKFTIVLKCRFTKENSIMTKS